MSLTDTHCHLNSPEFAGRVGEVIERAADAGVTELIVPGWDEASSLQALALSAAYPGVRAAIGYHPWFVSDPPDYHWLQAHLDDPHVSAIGEIGLDWEADTPHAAQEKALRGMLAIAHARNLPVLIHCRHGWDIMLRLLGECPVRGVMHAFSASLEVMHECLKRGMYISFAGMVTRPNSRRAHAAAKAVPADRLLLETDAPFIALEGIPAGTVEPMHLPGVLHYIARLRGEDPDTLAAQIAENVQTLFR